MSMKIERVNERQIRCTLTGDDLATRQLKISELAYGSEKAKNLFRDMMKQAEFEFGFEAEDIPLVIEAIPVNADCIILIITKVDDPEELDTRFSRFAPSVSDAASSDNGDASAYAGGSQSGQISEFAEDMINMLKEVKASIEQRQIKDAGETSGSAEKSDKEEEDSQPMLCTLSCASIGTLVTFAKSVASFYKESSDLYRNPEGGYTLLLTSGSMSQKEFARVCNCATEFGDFIGINEARLSYITEHYEVILQEKAIENLCRI
ncbi:MAG: adaptor protein MecA [Lachnospiraceae bacterium]|nr:adaptor protein MecA [Lachnospiraceae bacterium]